MHVIVFKYSTLFKEARNNFSGFEVDLFKSNFLTQGLLRFPSYYTAFLTYAETLCFR